MTIVRSVLSIGCTVFLLAGSARAQPGRTSIPEWRSPAEGTDSRSAQLELDERYSLPPASEPPFDANSLETARPTGGSIGAELAGGLVGLLAAVFVGGLVAGVSLSLTPPDDCVETYDDYGDLLQECGFRDPELEAAAWGTLAGLTTMIFTVPAGVTLAGSESGGGGDYGSALLGSLVGTILGVGIASPITSIVGSILGYEASYDASESWSVGGVAPSVQVSRGELAVSLSTFGRF